MKNTVAEVIEMSNTNRRVIIKRGNDGESLYVGTVQDALNNLEASIGAEQVDTYYKAIENLLLIIL